MTGREKLSGLFAGKTVRENVVCLHSWGRYVFEHLGRTDLWDKGASGEVLANAYLDFIRDFPIDWIHVVDAWGGRHRRNPDGSPAATINPALEVKFPDHSAGALEATDIDRYYDAMECFSYVDNGNFDHVWYLSRKVGRELMIFPNIGGPCGELDTNFESALIQAIEDPERAHRNLLTHCRGYAFATVKAARMCGADGFIFSLGYGGAMDVISPDLTRKINIGPWTEFFAQLRRIGVLPVGYFLGNIHPFMDIILETKPAGIMIEETKKGFVLDPVEIRKKLPPEIVLFGNVDSALLWRGTPKQIEAEVRRQAAARDYGPFVFMNGSPICPDTPADNIRAFLDAARSV